MHNITLLHNLALFLMLISFVCLLLLLALIALSIYNRVTKKFTYNHFLIKNNCLIAILLVVSIVYSICMSFNFSSQVNLSESTSPSGNLTVKLNADLNKIKIFAKNNTDKFTHYANILNFRFNPGLEGISPSHTALEWDGDNLNIIVFDTGSDFSINIWIDPLSNEIKYTKKTIPHQ